jgi:hypothetical protein
VRATYAYRILRDIHTEAQYLTQLKTLGAECEACRGTGTRARSRGGWGNVALEGCTTCQGCGYLPKEERK